MASTGDGRDAGSQRRMAPRKEMNAASVGSPCSVDDEMRNAAAMVLVPGSRRLPRELVMLSGVLASSKNLLRRGEAASSVGGGTPITSIMHDNCRGENARKEAGKHA